jgi:hypothetical protein
MKTKDVIYHGKEMLVLVGYEDYKEYIVVDGQKIFSQSTQYFEYSNEGVNKGSYIDCVKAVDKYGCVINVGDTLYASVKNEVVLVKVTKIADTPYHLGYGCHRRKLTVKCTDTDKTYTLPAGDRCIKQ